MSFLLALPQGPASSTLFPYTRSSDLVTVDEAEAMAFAAMLFLRIDGCCCCIGPDTWVDDAGERPPRVHSEHAPERSEEHTSELQSHSDLVCRLLLEKKKALHAD